MGERTEHPEEPAEGAENPGQVDDESDSDPDPESGGVADDIASAMPGRLNQDLDNPEESDPELSPDEPVGSA